MNKNKPITYQQLLREELKNPEFRRLWESEAAERKLANDIIKARIAKNMSQRELAKRAKTTQAVVSRVESQNTSPSLKTIYKIAQALGKRLEVNLI